MKPSRKPAPSPAQIAGRLVLLFAFLTGPATSVLAAPEDAPKAKGITTSTVAAQAILIDAGTGAELFAKNADERMAPSSMTKMMTIYMLFERLKAGSLSLDDSFIVSEKAWRTGGSKMFIEVNQRIKIGDLLRGIIVQSGNDASIAVAEGIAGSEEAFAEEMNRKALELGMTGSHFVNASGWPDENHYSTARDLAILSLRTIEDFPEYYDLYKETSFTYSDIRQENRNPLLYAGGGADGLKTGHTEAGGYGLAASAKRDGRRLVLVVNGLASERARAVESRRLLDWGFREFDNYTLFSAGETVTEADVWLGAEKQIPLRIERDVVITLARRDRDKLKVAARFEQPIPAPIDAGTPVANLLVETPHGEARIYPLVAGKEVAQLGAFGRLQAAVNYLLWGSLN